MGSPLKPAKACNISETLEQGKGKSIVYGLTGMWI